MTSTHYYYGTGRRKSSVARVFLKKGTGKITVNKKPVEEFFGRPTDTMVVQQPLVCTGLMDRFDLSITVKGGGSSGQAGAIRHGIARALMQYDETPEGSDEGGSGEGESGEGKKPVGALNLRRLLRAEGHVTRDAREVQRKKPGFRKARKKKQYSKR